MSVFTDLASQIYAGAAGRFDFILALFENTKYAKERLDAHTHSGVDGSTLIRIGGNLLRNGSFEDDAVGTVQPTSWAFTPASGGAGAVSATDAHGSQSYAITSTNLSVGGGSLLSEEFIECGANQVFPWQAYFWGYGAAATVTMTIATPCVVTMASHGMAANTPFVFSTTGALPTNVDAGKVYYVSATGLASSTFQFSATVGGSSIATGGTQSGVHTATRCTSGKMQAIWYDQVQAQISTSDLFSSISLPVAKTIVSGTMIAPDAARYVRLNHIGGIPAAVSSVGTTWIDGVNISTQERDSEGEVYVSGFTINSTSSTTFAEIANVKMVRTGRYRFSFYSPFAAGNYSTYARVYRNGVAVGLITVWNASVAQTITIDAEASAGDTMQIFARSDAGFAFTPSTFKIGASAGALMAINYPIGVRS